MLLTMERVCCLLVLFIGTEVPINLFIGTEVPINLFIGTEVIHISRYALTIERVCCLLLLTSTSVASAPQWIRQPKPRDGLLRALAL